MAASYDPRCPLPQILYRRKKDRKSRSPAEAACLE
jgi:hypothetical protein